MQQLQPAPGTETAAENCAVELLATIPSMMRFLRSQMRQRREGLTVPHFRALIFVTHYPDAGLSELAEHIGLSLPAASRLVAVLVRRGLMLRAPRPENRRRVSLTLTRRGRALFLSAYGSTQQALSKRLAELSPGQLRAVAESMQALGGLFGQVTLSESQTPQRGASR